MKRRLKKQVITVVLAAVAAAALSACNGTEQAETASADSKAAGEKAQDGRPSVSIMLKTFSGTSLANENSDKVIAMVEEHTGTKVEWLFEQDATYNEKFGLTLMDRDNMPMILSGPDATPTANVIDAAKKGAFWDLSSFINDAEAYPNLSQYNPEVMESMMVDGQIIAVYKARELGRYGFSYRKDWAEAVGITEDPRTIEDVYNMMYAFTYDDPDGNGKDDTYGLELTKYTGPLDIIQSWFGVGNEWVERDGKLVPVHQTEEYLEALKWMRKLYEDGLIRQDWAAVDQGTFSEGIKKGEAGVYVDVMGNGTRIWRYFRDNGVPSVTDPSATASMSLVGPIEGKTLATSGCGGYFMLSKASVKTEEDVKNCLHFLDKMCDDEMLLLGDYGLEGIDWNLNEKGEVVKTNAVPAEQMASNGLNQAFTYIPNLTPVSPKIEQDEPGLAQEAAIARNREVAVLNPALGYLANSDVNAEVGTDIEQIIDDARTQYICGQLDDAGLAEAAQTWLDRGGDRLIEDINAQYSKEKE